MYAIIDCNSFYCSCEQVFRPDIADKPVVVLSNNDGCVIARNAKAKERGVAMAGPAFKIQHLFQEHDVQVFSSNYTLYADMSRRVMNVLQLFCPKLELYSIDECFAHLEGMAAEELEPFARKLKEAVGRWVKIPVSVGIGATKTLAKAANRLAKKNKSDVWVLGTEEERERCLRQLPIGDVWGIGRQHQSRLLDRGVTTAYEFTQLNQGWVRKNMSVVGERTFLELRGIPCLEIQDQRESKDTICTSRSFGKLLTTLEPICDAVATHANRCAEKLRSQQSAAQIVHVFLITNRHRKDLPQYNPSLSYLLPVASSNTPELVAHAVRLLKEIYKPGYHYMKAGVILSAIQPNNPLQADLFDTVDRAPRDRVSAAMDLLNRRFGQDVVRTAVQGYERQVWGLRCQHRSPDYTTRAEDMPVAWSTKPTPAQKQASIDPRAPEGPKQVSARKRKEALRRSTHPVPDRALRP